MILDAMGCQRAIVSKILERGADSLVTLEANQGKIFRAVEQHCADACFARGTWNRPACDAFDDKHGRSVRGRVFSWPQAALLEPLRDWPGLKTVLAVESIRSINGSGKTETEVRCFLSSANDSPEVLASAIRQHWSIEKSLPRRSMSPSAKTIAGSATELPSATWHCCARLPSTLSEGTTTQKAAYEEDAKAKAGTTTPCVKS